MTSLLLWNALVKHDNEKIKSSMRNYCSSPVTENILSGVAEQQFQQAGKFFFPSRIPLICPYWYTTALFRPVKVHQKVHKFATKQPKLAKKD